MAYTIQFLAGGEEKQYKVLNYLNERLVKEGAFKAKFIASSNAKGQPIIIIKQVRLVKAKPYCGNHPGPCELNGQKKKTMTFLEWEDWIKFHGLVNRVLNRFKCNADVWSEPQDVRGKMYMRRGLKPRIHYDYDESFNQYGIAVRIWNQGTSDQFENESKEN